MASNLRRHFADPHHSLQETEYSHDQPGHCSICLLKLAGHKGYGCHSCNIHIHRVCAGYFGETIAIFAHPSHTLRLSRSPGRICNICRGDCPQGSFVYRCCTTGCGFDVHPLCAMLPERVGSRSPLHQGHELRMVSSSSPGCCSACHRPMPVWRYVCSCSKEIHVECAVNPPTGGADGTTNGQSSSFGAGAQGSQERSFGGYGGQGQGWYNYGPTPVYNNSAAGGYGYGPAGQQGIYYGGPVVGGYSGHPGGYYAAGGPPAMPGGYGATSSGHNDVLNNPGSVLSASAIAMFLVDTVINTAASEFLSQLVSGILFG
ncbi:hypothetical protein U9M48_015859 [Paspalum notatum var. saurae]|uniref:Phorbol-ester/DAG-type domain-containing protein n=1 Tax=Paspalum notatum var. saurae TaxID=547442 RepID=A0AAQ3T7E1_PASNO